MISDMLMTCNGEGTTPSIDLSDGLVAQYLLNNNPDDITGNYDLADNGTPVYSGETVYMPNVDYIEGTGPDMTGDFTVSVWLPSVVIDADDKTVISWGESVSARYLGYIILQNDDIIYGNYYNQDSALGVVVDDSIHVVFTYKLSTNTNTLYVNGAQVHTFSDSSFIGSNKLSIGRSGAGIFSVYPGNISNVRIYNEAKDQEFITALYEEGYSPRVLPEPTTSGLIAYYPLNGTADDETGNYNGTENGVNYVDDETYGTIYDGTGSITIPNSSATSNTYWEDTGSGWNFVYSTTIKSSLSTNKYRNLRMYNKTLTAQEQTDIYEYEKAYRNIAVQDGLVAYYPLTNNSNDNNFNEYDGTDTSMTYDAVSGVFNGTNSYITLGGNSNIYKQSQQTVSYWAKNTDLTENYAGTVFSNNVALYSDGSNSNSGFRIYMWSTTAQGMYAVVSDETFESELGYSPGENYQISLLLPNINPDEYTHITWVLDSNKLTVYKNGVKYDSVTTSQSVNWGYNGAVNMGREVNASATRRYLEGNISKFRVYEKALLPEQVQAIYNSEKGDFE